MTVPSLENGLYLPSRGTETWEQVNYFTSPNYCGKGLGRVWQMLNLPLLHKTLV